MFNFVLHFTDIKLNIRTLISPHIHCLSHSCSSCSKSYVIRQSQIRFNSSTRVDGTFNPSVIYTKPGTGISTQVTMLHPHSMVDVKVKVVDTLIVIKNEHTEYDMKRINYFVERKDNLKLKWMHLYFSD